MTGIIIPAAGESRRLGQPKQLLPWQGKPLIRHAAEIALEAHLGPVTIVLGAIDAPCREALAGLPLNLTFHPGWSLGIGGSISAGLRALPHGDLAAVIVFLVDQPLVTSADLHELVSLHRCGRHDVVTSRFEGGQGPPVLFSADHFHRLLTLDPADGARSVIRAAASPAWHPCPAAATDIDTPEAWQALLAKREINIAFQNSSCGRQGLPGSGGSSTLPRHVDDDARIRGHPIRNNG